MSNRDIVVIGASMGGIEALQQLVRDLPGDLPAAILVVLHTASSSPNVLDRILGRATALPVHNARDREPIRPGAIYIAPADHHLIVEGSRHVRLTRGPKENRFRPAIDPLFRSAAYAFGPRVIGVVLTGFLDDGTAGLWAVKQCGGTAIVQDPKEALAPSMPASALRHVDVDHCVELHELGPLLVRLVNTPAEKRGPQPASKQMDTEVRIASEDNALESGMLSWGEPSTFACPECHGVLFQLKEGTNLRLRCHTGHAYSLEALLAELGDQVDVSLWNALRAAEEVVLLLRRMAARLGSHEHESAADVFLKKATAVQDRIALIRQAVMRDDSAVELSRRESELK